MDAELRSRVIEEAHTWLGTPYHHRACVKGHGVDCAMLPLAVYAEVGCYVMPSPLPEYHATWYLHQNEELFLEWVAALGGVEVSREPLPGDFIVYQVGRCYAHGMIAVEEGMGIHADLRIGRVARLEVGGEWLTDRKFKVFEV